MTLPDPPQVRTEIVDGTRYASAPFYRWLTALARVVQNLEASATGTTTGTPAQTYTFNGAGAVKVETVNGVVTISLRDSAFPIPVYQPSNDAGTVRLNFRGVSRYVGAITLGANVSTLEFVNLPSSGNFAEYELHIAQDATGSRTFALPASHKALGGSDTAIASAANAVTVLRASTVDSGATWRYVMQESA